MGFPYYKLYGSLLTPYGSIVGLVKFIGGEAGGRIPNDFIHPLWSVGGQ